MDDEIKSIKFDKFKTYKIVVIFTAIFFVLIFNFYLIPSVFDTKDNKIEKFINFLGYSSYYQPKCDAKCANNCLFNDQKSEEVFKSCLKSCNCLYNYIDNGNTSLTGVFIKIYFVFSILSSLLAIIYIKKHVLIQKYRIIKTYIKTNNNPVNDSEEPEYQKLMHDYDEENLSNSNKINLLKKNLL
jgi:hypothetical protein